MHVEKGTNLFVFAVRVVGVANIAYSTEIFRKLRKFDNIMEMPVNLILFLAFDLLEDGGSSLFLDLFLHGGEDRGSMRGQGDMIDDTDDHNNGNDLKDKSEQHDYPGML
jgi:hypothetical protein